eukprot:4022411-Pyramimonas_sp.AAC.1
MAGGSALVIDVARMAGGGALVIDVARMAGGGALVIDVARMAGGSALVREAEPRVPRYTRKECRFVSWRASFGARQ